MTTRSPQEVLHAKPEDLLLVVGLEFGNGKRVNGRHAGRNRPITRL